MLDLEKLNPDCRFVMIRYIWSQSDRDGEPPCRHWQIDKRTPILPLTFMEFHYTHDWHPYYCKTGHFTERMTTDRLPSLVVCDLFPYSCIRLTYSRFIIARGIGPAESPFEGRG